MKYAAFDRMRRNFVVVRRRSEVDEGSGVLVGEDPERIDRALKKLVGDWPSGRFTVVVAPLEIDDQPQVDAEQVIGDRVLH